MLAYFGKNPEALEFLREDPARIVHAGEEFFRVITPLTHIGRVCPADTEIHGIPVKSKGRVSLCWASANQDEAVFEAPGEVRLDRKPNPHLAFGFGAHLCLGAAHARLLLRTLLQKCTGRLTSITVLDARERVENESAYQRVMGYESLQIQALFARCRVREQHGALSNSSCLVSIDVRRMRTAAENLEKLLRAIGYRGLFSVEFKLDHRDGLFKFIEVNTRVWADMALALRCGVNVVDMLYRDALGREVRPVRGYKVGQHWVSMYRDRSVAMNLIASRQLSWSRFARSWMGAAFDVFSLNDPKPAIWDFRQRLRWRRHQHVPAPSGVLKSANRL